MHHWADLVGYLASVLVVLTFYMDDMFSLRVAAVMSNIAFLAYGSSLGLGPVIVLHGVLLPLNIWRLRQLHRCRRLHDDRNATPRRWRAASGLSDWRPCFHAKARKDVARPDAR